MFSFLHYIWKQNHLYLSLWFSQCKKKVLNVFIWFYSLVLVRNKWMGVSILLCLAAHWSWWLLGLWQALSVSLDETWLQIKRNQIFQMDRFYFSSLFRHFEMDSSTPHFRGGRTVYCTVYSTVHPTPTPLMLWGGGGISLLFPICAPSPLNVMSREMLFHSFLRSCQPLGNEEWNRPNRLQK